MKNQLPFFNFSIKKVLAAEPDTFKKAKLQIIIAIISFSVIKSLLVMAFAFEYEQYRQFYRSLAIVVAFLGLFKVVLYRPSYALVISHIMLVCGVLLLWSNLLIYIHTINIITIQLMFMTTLVSYYLIGGTGAAIYSALALSPVLYYLLTRYTVLAHFNIDPQELAAPGTDLVLVLNFMTFISCHYFYYRAFSRNLQEKDELNKQLQVNVAEAKALAYSRSLFLSTMSHELRTPLNGVIGMAHLLKDSAQGEQVENLNILEFSANNLLSVINDVLDYNKIELDKIELEASAVSLPALLRKISSGIEMKAAEKGLTLLLEIDNQLETLPVITDPTRLTQILYNLAGNAIKFTDKGTVKICATVLELMPDRMIVGFSVTDTGIGIAKDRQKAIFDPFIQGSTDTTRKFGGTGLGLAIVKKLLRLFGSAVRLESSDNEGSQFMFNIEFALCNTEQTELVAYKPELAEMSGFRVLIAEDNRINVLILEKILSKWEIQTVVAENGLEAVGQVMNHTFDAVLMDIHMPVMDGYDAALAIRKLSDPVKANIPIIAVTASVSHNLYSKIKEAGMQDYINKPFQPNQLLEKLKQLYKPIH
jgi:signal transduction histidine kinase/CheY-like chemotaxis protein